MTSKEDFYTIEEEVNAGGSAQVFRAVEIATKATRRWNTRPVPIWLGEYFVSVPKSRSGNHAVASTAEHGLAGISTSLLELSTWELIQNRITERMGMLMGRKASGKPKPCKEKCKKQYKDPQCFFHVSSSKPNTFLLAQLHGSLIHELNRQAHRAIKRIAKKSLKLRN